MKIIDLTKESFVEKVADYQSYPDNWEYKGRLDIYKVDVDQEEELESAFKIRTIPNLLLCPVNGKPIMKLGTMNKVQLKELIETTLFS